MAQSKEKLPKTKIVILFLFSLFSMIFFSSFTNFKFIYFAPILIFLFYRLSFISTLWIATFFGVIQDLLSSSFFGINTLTYLFTSVVLYKEKRFFNEKPINLAIYTAVFSLIFSIFNPLLFFIFDKKINLTIKWIAADLIMYPVLDGIYALIFFGIYIIVFDKILNIGLKSLWLKYKNKSSYR